MKSDGDTLETFKTTNNLHGASYLRDRIISAAVKTACSEVHIGLKPHPSTVGIQPCTCMRMRPFNN
ncbi:hypothetical protein HTL2_005342 [Paenibacillus melissococcoides]|nr:hypothetical protein [Paenibacillus melissococcoides]CAH8708595.1 hypothetical protein HTL2_002038 [Paenibacillus melissococcoides]CAH8718642.1 hypothetical protein HTL2_005342 [Paenibacillus melissococcoides]